jgi:hypothetical protein
MNYFIKRALILLIFGIVFAGSVIAVELVLSSQQKQSAEAKPSASVSPSRTEESAVSLPPAPPAVTQPVQIAEKKPASSPPSPAGTEKEESDGLKELFDMGIPAAELDIDQEQVARMLRTYVTKNHPDLHLSDREYERMAHIMKIFREANYNMNSLERTSANAPAIRRSMQEMATAMQDFQQITGMSQGEFFLDKDVPIQFGGEEELSENAKNEIPPPDFLVDHQS